MACRNCREASSWLRWGRSCSVLPPRQWIDAHVLDLARGEKLTSRHSAGVWSRRAMPTFRRVTAHGEFAVRGSLLDIYPMGSESPVRIDLFDAEIDSIRVFDPETQRSTGQFDSCACCRRESTHSMRRACVSFAAAIAFASKAIRTAPAVYRQVSDGMAPAGIEYYLPLFYERLETLFDYLPRNAVLIDTADAPARAGLLWNDIVERYEQRRHDTERPVLAPEEIFLQPEEVLAQLSAGTLIEVSPHKIEPGSRR